MKHPNKKYEAIRKQKCKSILWLQKYRAFTFWMKNNNQERKI